MTEKNAISVARDDWDRHWDEYTQTNEDNPAQSYRREVIFSLLDVSSAAGSGVRLLDIGSGQGDFAAAANAKFPAARILGLELSHSGVEISRRKAANATFLQCNLLDTKRAPEEWGVGQRTRSFGGHRARGSSLRTA